MHVDSTKLFWDDAFVFSFEEKVREVLLDQNRVGVVLEGTYFYPEGGGQPSDRGALASFPLLDVQEVDDRIVHFLARSPQSEKYFSPGMMVAGEIDREYRIHNMRLHTAAHILFGAARQIFSGVGYAGFNIAEVGSLYLDTSQQIRADHLRDMSQLANEVVVEDRPVTSYFVASEDTKNIKGLVYNMELPKGQVRIVDVDGWDVAACSGTHLKDTVQIGPIKVVAREIHKKNVTRINYAIGKRAVSEMSTDEKALGETAEMLSTSRDQMKQVVQKMSGELQGLQKDLRKMRELLVEYRLQELQNNGVSLGETCLIASIEDLLDANSLRLLATKLLAGRTSTVAVLVGGTNGLSIAVGCTPDLNLNLSQPVVTVAKRHGGGGGGKPNFVTAGGIQADARTVMDEIKSELAKLLAG